MQVIDSNDALAAFCAELEASDFITVDTEFMRERTYWPILCLIQAASDKSAAIIDPLANGLDLAPFLRVLYDAPVLKVFHAARQDIEIFVHMTGKAPAPLFDTQIAAMVCGFGESVGYETLVRQVARTSIDKGARFTDWSRRPLSEKQLRYALSDVTHLRDIYTSFRGQIEKSGRAHWLSEEMAILENPETYIVRPENAWKRLKLRGARGRRLALLIELAAWREQEAQTQDLPRNRVLKDEGLLEIAQAHPKSAADLVGLRSVSKGFERSKSGARLLEAVSKGAKRGLDDLPETANGDRGPAPPGPVVDLLKMALKSQCDAHGVAPKLIANSADLETLALDPDADIPATKGWRKEVFGEFAQSLLRGDIALRIKNGSVTWTD